MTRNIVFVCRQAAGEALLCARAIERLDDVLVHVVTAGDHDVAHVIASARACNANRIVTAQETLLETVAIATEALGLDGMRAATVRRALDKPSLKQALRDAGIRTPSDIAIADPEFPLILKPLKGSGGLATWRIRDREQLDRALALMPRPFVAEEYLDGEELCVDTITIDDEPRLASICCYRPSILTALENPHIPWTCIMPRELDGYDDVIDEGIKAVRALRVGNAVTHMEGVRLCDGSVAFIDATLRPAGARIGPMLGWAYDVDPHFAWARAAVDGRFDGPWERQYAVGTIFLRNPVDGIDEINDLIVDARMPQRGGEKSATYTGDGYITVRHPSTQVVEIALGLIARAASGGDAPPLSWHERLQYSEKQLYKPAWEGNRDCGST